MYIYIYIYKQIDRQIDICVCAPPCLRNAPSGPPGAIVRTLLFSVLTLICTATSTHFGMFVFDGHICSALGSKGQTLWSTVSDMLHCICVCAFCRTHFMWVWAQTPLTPFHRKGDHLIRTPMHTRCMPDAYPMRTRLIPRNIPRCSNHAYIAGTLACAHIHKKRIVPITLKPVMDMKK